MNAEHFAEWFRRRGRPVIRTASSYWCAEGSRSYQAFPYHWLIDPSEQELLDLLRGRKGLCLRYSAPPHAAAGMPSYHAMYEGKGYDIDGLGGKTRKNVRRALRACTVEPVSFAVVAGEGWRLEQDTLDRQARSGRLTESDWTRCWRAAGEIAGFEAWGAFVGRELAASAMTFQMEDCCYVLHQQSKREFLPENVNNALTFFVTQTVTARPGVQSVFYGLHSLDADASVDAFKFRMGYSAKPVRQRVVFHPAVAPLINRWTHGALAWAKRVRPRSPLLTKAEGMVRFYREGERPEGFLEVPAAIREDGQF